MDAPIEIRPYADGDREALTALWATVFPDDPPWNKPDSMLAAKLAFQPQGLLVGIAGGALAAAVMAGYDGHRGWINALAVAPEHRGKGYGEAMVEAALDELEAMGAVKVNLQIRGDNPRLRSWYESLGFAAEDCVSMGIRRK